MSNKIDKILKRLTWLENADDKCDLVKEKIGNIRKKHLEKSKGMHVEEDFCQPSFGPRSDESIAEDIVKFDLKKDLSKITDWVSEEEEYMFANSPISIIREAVIKDFDWSLKLCEALSDKSIFENNIWKGIFLGWKETDSLKDKWSRVLDYPIKNEKLLNFSHELSDLLLMGVDQEIHEIPLDYLDKAMKLARMLWDINKRGHSNDIAESDESWLNVSLNHYSGKIAEFWNRLFWKNNGNEKIANEAKSNLKIIIQEKTYEATLGKVIIAAQSFSSYQIDKTWALRNIMPLFDIDKNKGGIEKAWQGYLAWGKCDDNFFNQLHPLMRKIFKNKDMLAKNEMYGLSGFIAIACLNFEINPLDDEWLSDFSSNASAEALDQFSRVLLFRFSKMNSSEKSKIFEKWIRKYWSDRNDGLPVEFYDKEKKYMLELAAELDEEYKESIDLVMQMHITELKDTMIFRKIKDKNLASNFPDETLRLVLHLLEIKMTFNYEGGYLNSIAESLILKLRSFTDKEGDLKILCCRLNELKFEGADRLYSMIKDK